jgi:hypothetical protein
MEYYKDVDHDSDVESFEVGIGQITVFFKSGMAYVYTNSSCGAANVEEMVQLARDGNGLNSFIMNNVRDLYSDKFRYR